MCGVGADFQFPCGFLTASEVQTTQHGVGAENPEGILIWIHLGYAV